MANSNQDTHWLRAHEVDITDHEEDIVQDRLPPHGIEDDSSQSRSEFVSLQLKLVQRQCENEDASVGPAEEALRRQPSPVSPHVPDSPITLRYQTSECDIELEDLALAVITGAYSTDCLVPPPSSPTPPLDHRSSTTTSPDSEPDMESVSKTSPAIIPNYKQLSLRWPFLVFLFTLIGGLFAFLEYQIHDLPPLHYSMMPSGPPRAEDSSNDHMGYQPPARVANPEPRPRESSYPTPLPPARATHCGWKAPKWEIRQFSRVSCDDLLCEDWTMPDWCGSTPGVKCFKQKLSEEIETFTTDDATWCPCNGDFSSPGQVYEWGELPVFDSTDQGCKSVMSAIKSFNYYKTKYSWAESTNYVARRVLTTTPPPPARGFWAYPSTDQNGDIMIPLVVRTAGPEQMDAFGNSVAQSDTALFPDGFASTSISGVLGVNPCSMRNMYSGAIARFDGWGSACSDAAVGVFSTVWWTLPLSRPTSTTTTTTSEPTTSLAGMTSTSEVLSTTAPLPICTSCHSGSQKSTKPTLPPPSMLTTTKTFTTSSTSSASSASFEDSVNSGSLSTADMHVTASTTTTSSSVSVIVGTVVEPSTSMLVSDAPTTSETTGEHQIVTGLPIPITISSSTDVVRSGTTQGKAALALPISSSTLTLPAPSGTSTPDPGTSVGQKDDSVGASVSNHSKLIPAGAGVPFLTSPTTLESSAGFLRPANASPTGSVNSISAQGPEGIPIDTLDPPLLPGGPIDPDASSSFFNLQSEGAYLMASVIPVLLATLLSIPIQVLTSSVNSILPFRTMGYRPNGATAKDSVCLSRNPSLLGPLIISLRLLYRYTDLLPLLVVLLGIFSTVLTTLSSEVIRLELTERCGKDHISTDRTTFPDMDRVEGPGSCAIGLRKSGALIRVTEGLLVAMAILIIAIGVILIRWRSGVLPEPWSISSMSSLLSARGGDIGHLLRSVPAPGHGDKDIDVQIQETLIGKRFQLGFISDGPNEGTASYGITAISTLGQDKEPIRPTCRPPPDRKPISHVSKTGFWRMPGSVTQDLSLRILVLLFTLGLLILILYYENTVAPGTSFEAFMNSQSFGVRILFTTFGVVINAFWNFYFLYISESQIHNRLSAAYTAGTGLPAHESILLSPPENIFVGLWRSTIHMKDMLSFHIAIATLLAKFTPILLSNIPFSNAVTWKIHEACTWMAVAFLGHMVLVLVGTFVTPTFDEYAQKKLEAKKKIRTQGTSREGKRHLKIPVKVDTIAGCLHYLCDSKMVKDFEGLGVGIGAKKDSDKTVVEIARKYAMGEIVGVSGEKRVAVDYLDQVEVPPV